MLKGTLSSQANGTMSLPAVSSMTEVVTEEATCLQELSDAEAIHGPYNPQLLSAIQKLSDFYQKSGESTKLESMLQRTLMFDERTAGRIHRDTNGTSFKLTDVYIQGGKLKEARILLERIEESYRKLETNPNSKLRVLYQTEMDVERLVLRRLGLEFGKRNFHDGAVNMLERAFESHSEALGDTHTTTITVGKALSYSYLQQFYQQPLRDDRPRHQCVVKLAQLCERTLKVERGPIWMLGLMCLRSNDAVNASFAFKQTTNSGFCDVCKEKIKPRTRWLACKSCLLLFVCDGCYQKWEARTEHEKPLMATCAGHTFYIVGVEDTDQASARGVDDEEEVGLWLSKIIDQKTTQATTNLFLDYWERRGKPEELQEFRSPVYFYESDSLPAHVDEVKAKAVPMPTLKWRKSWTTVSVPMLLGLFFTPKGKPVRHYSSKSSPNAQF
jgi:tetratricopeptide (TPR) repeat protein